MPIVSSIATPDAHAQPDGSRHVTETHTDHLGRVYTRTYRAAAGEDLQAAATAYAAQLDAALAKHEFEFVTDHGLSAATLSYQTKAQFAARFWAAVRSAYEGDRKVEFARLVTWVYQRQQAGDFTSNEIRLSFNAAYNRSLNTTQWNSLVTTRIVPIVDRYLAMLAEGDL